MRKILLIIIAIAILLFLSYYIKSCRRIIWHMPPTYDTTVKKWVNLNILFKQGTDQNQKNFSLQRLVNYIKDSAVRNLPLDSNQISARIDTNTIKIDSCSCDNLLYNLNASLIIEEQGGSGSTGPKCTGNACVGAQGDDFTASVGDNTTFHTESNALGTLTLHAVKISNNKPKAFILAIIDGGIDSTLFDSQLKDILWRGDGSSSSKRNFTAEGGPNEFYDSTHSRHGSAVAALALEQFFNSGIYPQLMILKVFDSTETTSTFSVGCALKYAIDHNATVINASWGYSSQVPNTDSVMHYYIGLAAGQNKVIPIVAAAGNATVTAQDQICAIVNPLSNNIALNDKHFFYPACFTLTDGHVISVTGLNGNLGPCYYQDYSPLYITVGVQNTVSDSCCIYRPAYMDPSHFMEGTSFATPVISGKLMSAIMANPPAATTAFSLDVYLNALSIKPFPIGLPIIATKKGYITH